MSKEKQLLRACKEADFTQARDLLQQGCDPNIIKEEVTQATPLHYACQHGDLSIAKLLVETHNCDVECRDHKQQTPLHHSAKNGHKDVVRYLVEERKCNPEPLDSNGDSPLHKACGEGHDDVVKVLNKKCNPRLKNKEGFTPVQLATNRAISNLVRQHSEKVLGGKQSSRQKLGASTRSSSADQEPSSGASAHPTSTRRLVSSPGDIGGLPQLQVGPLVDGVQHIASIAESGYSTTSSTGSASDNDLETLVRQLASQLSLPTEPTEIPDDPELLVARVKCREDELTRDEYLHVKDTVASALNTSPDSLYFVQSVPLKEKSTSIELVHWGISNSLMGRARISPENEEKLKHHNVADIVYKGKCLFFNPGHYFEGGSGSGGSSFGGSFGIKYISSDDDFEREIKKAGDRPIVVEFTADWCPPSLYIAPHFAKLSVDYPDLLFLSVDADLCRGSVREFGVRSYPYFHFVKDGSSFTELNFSGYNVEKLYSRVEDWNRNHANYQTPPDDMEILVARVKVDDTTGEYHQVKDAVAAALNTTSSSLYMIQPGILPREEGSSNVNLVHWGISGSIMQNTQISPENEKNLMKNNVADVVYQGKPIYFNPMHHFGKSSMADVGPIDVRYITSDEDFKKALRDAKDGPIVIEFTAHWCPPSLYIAPFFAKLSVDYPDLLFLSVDVDLCEYASIEYGTNVIPAFHFMKSGHSFSELMFSGYNLDKLTANIGKWDQTHAGYIPPTKYKRTVTLWENGFSVDNGPLRTGESYSDKLFIKSIYNGETPQELLDDARGGVVDLVLKNKADVSYVRPKTLPFTGEGHALGGPACAKMDQPKKQQLTTAGLPPPILSPVAGPRVPSTRVRIRLAGGQVLCAEFKLTQTIQDIKDFIDRSNYDTSGADTNYILMTTIPRKEYTDLTQTIEEAKLCNALITQRIVPKSEGLQPSDSGWTAETGVKSETPPPDGGLDTEVDCNNPETLKTLFFCKLPLEHNYFGTASGPPVVSKYYHGAERVAAVPFLGPVSVLTCDHRGCQFNNEDHDVTVKIPEGAIPEGLVVHFEFAVTLWGPFNFSGSSRPISPILWMCPQEDFEFQKPFTITLPHYLSTEDLQSVVFGKATEFCYETAPNGQRLYDFKTPPSAAKPKFFSEDGTHYGSFQASHFCFHCLIDKDFDKDKMLKSGYLLHIINAQHEVHFRVTYFLSSCKKAILEMYPPEKRYKIQKAIRIELKPSTNGGEAHFQISLPDEESTRFGGIISLNPEDGMIKASDIDFWGCSEPEMEMKHEYDCYPPNIRLILNEFIQPQLCLKGCSREKDVFKDIQPHLKFSIESTLPPMDPRTYGWITAPNPLSPHSPMQMSQQGIPQLKVCNGHSTKSVLKMKDHFNIYKFLQPLEERDIIRVGQALGLMRPKLKKMKDLPDDMIDAWLNKEDDVLDTSGPPTWKSLSKALRDVNQNGIATDIENRYG